jgi:hypothetical protein
MAATAKKGGEINRADAIQHPSHGTTDKTRTYQSKPESNQHQETVLIAVAPPIHPAAQSEDPRA